ncbi:unnamed protein product [Brassica oleracea var. botrytis]
MDSASMEQAANLITRIMVWICACSTPSSLPCPSSIPSVSVSIFSICGAASSDCTSSVACGWVGIMVWICACSPPSLLPCPSSIPSVSVSICDISVDLKLDTLCLSLFYCQQDLSGQPACGNFKAYGFCKYGARCKFDHPVPVNPYHYAGLTMPSQPTAHGQPACGNFKAYGFCKYGARCKFDHPVTVNNYHYAGLTMPSLPTAYTIQHPNIRRTLITTNTKTMSRLFLLDRFFHGMWLVSICGAASSDCTSSVACGWVVIMVWICSCSPPSSLPCPSSIPSVSCAPLVSTHVRITSPPSRSDSITASNGDKSAAENQTSENEKQDDGPDKTEVQDSSKLSHSDSTALSNDAEYTSSEAKKGGDDPSAPDNSRGNDSSDNAAGS